VALWKDRLEDDGVAHTSERALQRVADAVVGDAVRGLRLAFLVGDVDLQRRAQLLLELVRLLRTDLQAGGWDRVGASDRRQLRRALLLLRLLAASGEPIPLG